ncbi:uncharacterized protein N7511_009495 [Penicillium nucicola]|uniref:uncharacterized protein n=1 Tax=Penicillium nucicola TaxID=1850975 RepID=UPI0025458AE2|nr:uncharacterized protein N7511_009495 [Penicillium nucicola]KAJ5747799.1 hypothetical protein N7511_009495 [Penicillium nucicola]
MASSKGQCSEGSERLKNLIEMQMSDLGTSRREVITTHDVFNDGGPLPGQLDADRECDKPGTLAYRLARANNNSLSAWSNFHKTITDTDEIEELEDINEGQSHRRALNDQFTGLRRPMPQLSSQPFFSTHPAPANSRGRGGGHAGTTRRSPHTLSPTNSRTSYHGGIVKTSNGHRSVSMPTGSRLDPALNINNDDIDPHAGGRGRRRGRGRGVDRGSVRATLSKRPLPPQSSTPQRPLIIPDMSSRLGDTDSFLSIMRNRNATMSKESAAVPVTPSTLMISQDQPLPSVMSLSLPYPKARSVTTPKPSASLPVPPQTKPVYKDQPLAERMIPKSPTPNRSTSRPQTSAISKKKAPVQTPKNTAMAFIGGTDTSTHVADLKQKKTADEHPHKKDKISPMPTSSKKMTPLAKAKDVKQQTSVQTLLGEGPSMTDTSTQTDVVSSHTLGEDLINLEWTTPPRQASFTSPNAAILQGLDMTPLVPSAPSAYSICASVDAESQRSELGFHDMISTRGKSEHDFIDIVSKAVNKSVRSAIDDYAMDRNVSCFSTSPRLDAAAIAQNRTTDSSQKLPTGISTPTRDMSHLEQWLWKANSPVKGSSFENHRSPHGSSPESADQQQSTRMPVPGLSPHKSEYSDMDTQPVTFNEIIKMIKPRGIRKTDSGKVEIIRRQDPFNPLESIKPVDADNPIQNVVPVAPCSTSVSTKPTGLLASKYASEPPVSFTKPVKKRPAVSAAKVITHDMKGKIAPLSQTAPSRPPGLAAPVRPPGLPLRPQATSWYPHSSAKVLNATTSKVTQSFASTGVRTIGPAPSVFQPTMLRGDNETATPTTHAQQTPAKMPLQTENWSANIAPASSNPDAKRRVSNLTFPRKRTPPPFSLPRTFGHSPGSMLPGFTPPPLTNSDDKVERKVSTLGPAPLTPRK